MEVDKVDMSLGEYLDQTIFCILYFGFRFSAVSASNYYFDTFKMHSIVFLDFYNWEND